MSNYELELEVVPAEPVVLNLNVERFEPMERVHYSGAYPTGAATTIQAKSRKTISFRPPNMINKQAKAIKPVTLTGVPTGVSSAYKIAYDNGFFLDLWLYNTTNDDISIPAGSITLEFDFFK